MSTIRDLNQLNVFARVAERRSFTKAAKDLRTTPSVVSRSMSELENALGFPLLNRSTHGVVLTEAGEALQRSCSQILLILHDFVIDMRNQRTGPYGALRVQAANSYCERVLSPLVSDFSAQYPQLRLHLIAADHNALEEGCDIILSERKPETFGLAPREIGRIRHVVCASPDYLRRHGAPQEPNQLRGHNCLANSESLMKDWPFSVNGLEIHVPIKGSSSSNSPAVLVQLTVDGVGITRVPFYAVASELASGQLIEILEDDVLSVEVMSAYYSKSRHLPAKVTDFVDFLVARQRAGAPGVKLARGLSLSGGRI